MVRLNGTRSSEEDRRASQEGIASLDRGEGVPMEEVEIFKGLKNLDRDAAGKDAFADAAGRVQRRPGEEQGGIASASGSGRGTMNMRCLAGHIHGLRRFIAWA